MRGQTEFFDYEFALVAIFAWALRPTELRKQRQNQIESYKLYQNFCSKYVNMLILALSVILESTTFKKSILRNNVILRNRCIIKLQ